MQQQRIDKLLKCELSPVKQIKRRVGYRVDDSSEDEDGSHSLKRMHLSEDV